MEYRLELKDRMQAAFGIIPNLTYVPGVIGNNALQNAIARGSNLGKKGYEKQTSKTVKNERKGKYALNNTFDDIRITSPVEYQFPLDPLVDVSWGFSNIITPVTKGYPVLEQTGKNLWAVRIRGIIWDGTEEYPESEVKAFVETFKEQRIFKVSSRIMNVYGITDLFIEDVSLPSLEGFEDTQPFEITAMSYKSNVLIIEENPVNV